MPSTGNFARVVVPVATPLPNRRHERKRNRRRRTGPLNRGITQQKKRKAPKLMVPTRRTAPVRMMKIRMVPIKNRMVPVENQEQGRSRPTRARRATTTTRSRRRKRNHRLLLQVQSHRPDRLGNFCRQSFSTHRWLHRRARVQHRVRMSPHKSN